MSLEVATTISGLDANNPAGTDQKSQGDDHIRLMKSVLKAAFPNADKAFYFPTVEEISADETVAVADENKHYIADCSGGSVSVTLPTSLGTGRAGFTVRVQRGASAANTLTVAPASGTINGLASVTIDLAYAAIDFNWTGTAWTIFYQTTAGIGPATVLNANIKDGEITKAKLASALQALLVPSGLIGMWGGNATPPTGWLLCTGAAISRTTYADLFTAIETTHGIGDGSTTFNLPDFGGRVGVGYEAVAANILTALDTTDIGDTGGVETHVLTVAQMPAHQHGTGIGNTNAAAFLYGNQAASDPDSITTDNGTTNVEPLTESKGGGEAHPNVQPSIVVPYIIKI